MKLLQKIVFPLLMLLPALVQAQIPIGTWRDHLPYRQGVAVTEGNGYVYCATEQGGVIIYDKGNNVTNRLTKVNGLSDVGLSDIKFVSQNNTVVISYTNGNIDLLLNKSVYNIADIKRSTIVGSKAINSIFVRSQLAYLACAFGIVVLETDRREIKDTYYIGKNGNYINVRDITSDNTYLYAATDSGIYRANLNAPNLADFNAWSKFTQLPTGKFNQVKFINGKLVASLSKKLTNNVDNQDTLYVYDGSSWSYFPPDTSGFTIKNISVSGGRLYISQNNILSIYDANFNFLDQFSAFQSGYSVKPRQVIRDAQGDLWVADQENGLIKVFCAVWCTEKYLPDGPRNSKVYNIDIKDGELWVAPGERNDLWNGQFNFDGVYYFRQNQWGEHSILTSPLFSPIRDFVSVTINPKNTSQVFGGTIGHGIVELNSTTGIVNVYDENNSSLQVRGDAPNSGAVYVFGSAFDEDGNLWVTNSLAPNPLSVRKKNGTWQAFNFGQLLNTQTMSQIIVTKNNQKWMVMPRGGGILVFNENGTWATNDDQYKKLTTVSGSGGLPSNEVYCLAEDDDGEIWVGTDKGIAVFYSPENIFSNSPSDAQPIYISQDGHTQLLLETEIITSIAIDGANRKWIGTQNSGVYLMSADGTQELLHFTENNSPLPSNAITSIKINGQNGEVFFGTEKGIVSYKSTATEGLEEFTDVYVYPNPVKPGYGGPIAIKGLVKNCDVKITDISGVLVYQTKALGGQAIWDGNNFSGERAHSGIYLVFMTNEDGSKTYVTKICLVN